MQQITQNLVNQIVSFYQSGQFEKVIRFIDSQTSLLKANPLFIQLYANSLRKSGQFDAAERCLVKGLKLFKRNPDLLNVQGNLYLDMGHNLKAVEQFKHALLSDPSRLDIKYNYARSLNRAQFYQKAIQQVSELLIKEPVHINARIVLAESYSATGKPELAIETLNDALKFSPGNVAALNNLANLYRNSANYELAIFNYEKAISVQPNNATLLQNLAACQVLNLDKGAALITYQRAISIAPDNWNLQEELAKFLWSEGEGEPFRFIEKQIQQASCTINFKFSYINLLLKVEKFEEALGLIETIESEAIHPTQEALVLKARILRELSRFSESLECSKNAMALSGNFKIGAMSEHGYALLSIGEPAAAYKMFSKLSDLEPKNQGWWTMISTCWFMLGESARYQWLCNYGQLVYCNALCDTVGDGQNLNNQLKQLLDGLHQSKQHPIGQSLYHGTQTYEELLESNESILQELKARILQKAKEFVASHEKDKKHPFLSRLSSNLSVQGSWSVKLRTEGYHKSHYHPEGWLSGVYYVDLPAEVNDGGQGWLVFGRAEIPNQTFEGDLAVKPKVGNVVFFPSYMWHGTNPFFSAQHRLTVAFDIIPN